MTVILVTHILVSIVLIIVVLMQRSEGGALGIGGGGGGGAGGLMTGRGVAGALVRTTIIFGAIFFITSIGLTTIASKHDRGGLTEIEEGLIEEFGTDPVGDGLNIEALEDADDLGIDLSTDPLAVTPAPATDAPAETDDEAAPADPLADPQ